MKIEAYLKQSPLAAVYRAQSLMMQDFQARLKNYDVHFLQALILTSVLFENREVRPTELSRYLNVTPSSLSHALRDLERKNLLRRTLHRLDARGYQFDLTPTGRKRAVALVKIFDKVQSGLEEVRPSYRSFVAELGEVVTAYLGIRSEL